MLCEDLKDISRKWESFSAELGFTYERQEKIRKNIERLEDVVDYCYFTVLEKWITGEKDSLTKKHLVDALVSMGNPCLAESIWEDLGFKLDLRYLSKKLEPIKYDFMAYGALLELYLPNYDLLTTVMDQYQENGLRMVVVIIQWLGMEAGNFPSKEKLMGCLLEMEKDELAEELEKKYEGNYQFNNLIWIFYVKQVIAIVTLLKVNMWNKR